MGLAAALVLLAAGCRGEREQELRSSAGALARAVEVLRAAPPEQRAPLLKALENVACSAEDQCRLKETCVEAYGLERRALDALSAVRRAAAGTDPVSAGAGELLARIEADLAAFRDRAKECADLEGEARRRYGL